MKKIKKLQSPGAALYLSVLKRCFWVPLVLSILNVVIISFTSSFRFHNAGDILELPDLSRLLNGDIALFLIDVAVSCLIGCVMLSYINKVSSAAFIHSLPLSRTEIFLSHYLAGCTLIAIPALVSAIYLSLRMGVSHYMLYGILFLGVYLLYGIGVYSFAILVSQISANTLGSLIFTVFGLAAPAICEGFVLYLVNERLYGYAGDSSEFWLSRHLYLEPRMVGEAYCLIYIAAILIFTALALFLFKRRALELAGDLIAFSGIRKATVYICGILAGMCAYMVFNGNLLMFLLFGIICAVLVNFAVRKRFTVKGAITPCTVILATTLFIFLLFRYDLTGFERRIPDAEDVESARFYYRYYGDNALANVDGKTIYYTDEFMPPITDSSAIQALTELHEDLIDNKYYYSSSDESRRYTLEYKLKNGKTMKRRYFAYYEKNAQTLEKVLGLYEVKRHNHDILEKNITVTQASVQGLYGEAIVVQGAENARKLAEALRLDIAESSYEHNHDFRSFAASSYATVRIYYYINAAQYSDGTPVPLSILAEHGATSTREYIYPCYKNTLALLSEIAPQAFDDSAQLPENPSLTVGMSVPKGVDGARAVTYEDVTFTEPEIIKDIIREGFRLSDCPLDKSYYLHSTYVTFSFDDRYFGDFRVHARSELIEKYVLSKNPHAVEDELAYIGYDFPHVTTAETSSYITY